MIKSFGKYIAKKVSGIFAEKAAKYCFWSTVLFFGPGPIVATIGVPGLAVAGLAAHSGIAEYIAKGTVGKILS